MLSQNFICPRHSSKQINKKHKNLRTNYNRTNSKSIFGFRSYSLLFSNSTTVES